MKLNDEYSKTICIRCWNIINEFHSLYSKVEAAHKELNEKFEKKEIVHESLKTAKIEPNITCENDSIDEFECLPDSLPADEAREEMKQSIQIPASSKKLDRNPKEKAPKDPSRILKSKSKRLEDEEKIRDFFNLSCGECAITFSTFFELKLHQKSVHNHKEGFVYCCKKKISRQDKLIEHMNWHLNPDSFR